MMEQKYFKGGGGEEEEAGKRTLGAGEGGKITAFLERAFRVDFTSNLPIYLSFFNYCQSMFQSRNLSLNKPKNTL